MSRSRVAKPLIAYMKMPIEVLRGVAVDPTTGEVKPTRVFIARA